VVDDDDATVIVDGFQFFVEPADPETFEIDADATSFMGYAPMLVNFGATALNGTGPFTYTWNFGDGTPPATGDRVSHVFEKIGRIDVIVTGQDAAGDTSSVQLALFVFTPEEWAKQRNVEVATLPTPSPRP
jgi:PKD repeat protein